MMPDLLNHFILIYIITIHIKMTPMHNEDINPVGGGNILIYLKSFAQTLVSMELFINHHI